MYGSRAQKPESSILPLFYISKGSGLKPTGITRVDIRKENENGIRFPPRRCIKGYVWKGKKNKGID